MKNVTNAINLKVKEVGELDDYTIVWKQLQDIAVREIVTLLGKNFRGCSITIPESKLLRAKALSVYGCFGFL